MTAPISETIDMHCHVGLVGDRYPHLGYMEAAFRQELRFKLFLLYARIEAYEVNDDVLRHKTEQLIDQSALGQIVCLAQDHVFDETGRRRQDRTRLWVSNEYVLELRSTFPHKVLLGASVHPYHPEFRDQVKHWVDAGAVLLKWVPSAQQIDLADPRVRSALEFLATAGPGGHALPLLLHVGGEYANPTSDPRARSYDFLTWSLWDGVRNLFRGKNRWYRPRLRAVHRNLHAGLEAGATIIFSHVGLPYWVGGPLGGLFEHSDFDQVRDYLRHHGPQRGLLGRCYADVSACVTPFRQAYYPDLAALPPEALLFGSDFPTPVFELTATPRERLDDLRAVIEGDLSRLIVPEQNLLDVNYHELARAFPGHPMFTNFRALVPEPALTP
jgi:predicted TIM-barrel fold metal-dependent hydrolase